MQFAFNTRSFFICAAVLFWSHIASGATYYVDFVTGDDSRAGQAQAEAWKHAPGDPQAAGNAKSAALKPGDVVQFRAGVVYRGQLAPSADGSADARLVYRGMGWGEGKAILDGSDLVTGWQPCKTAEDAYGNPNFAKLQFAEIEVESPFLLNLHEINSKGEDEFLWMSQSPNPADPFFFDRRDSFHTVTKGDLTTTTITAPDVLTQSDPNHYKDASVLIWVNPNFTRRYKIESYDPAQHRITFKDIGANAIYKDRDQSFAIYNSPHAIDQPGEYFLSEPNQNGKRRLLLWPRSPEKLDQRISRSVRGRGFHLTNRQFLEIDGFEVRKYAGQAQDNGSGIAATGCKGLLIRNNVVTHNMSADRGYGGIFLSDTTDSIVEANHVSWNKGHRGIFVSSVENVIVRGNKITYPGATALPTYRGKRVQFLENDISHVYGTHANAITIYIASENVLVAGNRISDATTPITFQDSGPLYFINNFADGGNKHGVVNEWGNTGRGPWAVGQIVFLNNTFVNAAKDNALSIGKDAKKTYVVINNVLDGANYDRDKAATVTRSHNLYVGLANFQSDRYGWKLGEKEVFDEKADPANPPTGGATDVRSYLPKDVFPEIDFEKLVGAKIGAQR